MGENGDFTCIEDNATLICCTYLIALDINYDSRSHFLIDSATNVANGITYEFVYYHII